ncbi:MAG: YbhB/YbcL family Raf kinase inhibitor-like protein [Myxococcales bacterium]
MQRFFRTSLAAASMLFQGCMLIGYGTASQAALGDDNPTVDPADEADDDEDAGREDDDSADQMATDDERDAGQDTSHVDADSAVPDAGISAPPTSLWSPTIANGGTFPALNTCGGADISPSLSWPPGPAGTLSYAVVLRNLDAVSYDPDRVLWAIWDIPSTVTSLPADLGADPMPSAVPGAKQVSGSAAAAKRYYRGPCANGMHPYQISRYALAGSLSASVLRSPAEIEAYIQASGPLESLSLIASYTGP